MVDHDPRSQTDRAQRAKAGAHTIAHLGFRCHCEWCGNARDFLGLDVIEALYNASQKAREGMEASIPLVARKGRASYLGERSRGHQDPGATSSYFIIHALYEVIVQHQPHPQEG